MFVKLNMNYFGNIINCILTWITCFIRTNPHDTKVSQNNIYKTGELTSSISHALLFTFSNINQM